jgi:hypothetical protein
MTGTLFSMIGISTWGQAFGLLAFIVVLVAIWLGHPHTVAEQRHLSKRARVMIAAGVLIAALVAHIGAAVSGPLAFDPALTGLHNIYSPSFVVEGGTPTLYLGGWLTPDECRFGGAQVGDCEDAIYRSELTDHWSWPVKVFSLLGYHVNDPSVIRPPSTDGVDRSSWTFAYVTVVGAHDGAPRPNWINLLVQSGPDQPWWNAGTVLGDLQQTDGCGAWVPSALVVGDEIHVYWNRGEPCYSDGRTLYRTRFAANGWQQIDTVQVNIPFPTTNPDVSFFRGGLQLWSNSGYGLTRMVSDDGGLSFTIPEGQPLPAITGEPGHALNSPTCFSFWDGFCWLLWAEAESGVSTEFHTIRARLLWFEE